MEAQDKPDRQKEDIPPGTQDNTSQSQPTPPAPPSRPAPRELSPAERDALRARLQKKFH